jgi:glycosyltransferase involved in cell wall biosynthesis
MSAQVAWALGGMSGLSAGIDYIRQIQDREWRSRLKHLGLLASAVELVRWSKDNGIDHIHGHSCANSAHVLAISHRLGGPPYSLTLHGDLNVYGTDHQLKMAGAKVIFVVGAHLREQLLRIGVPADKIVSTFMGIDTARLATLGTERSYVPGEIHLATVARLDPVKGHLHTLAAIARARETGARIKYSIAGGGSFEGTIVSKINELGLSDCVELTGTLSESEVCSLLSKTDVFVLSSFGSGEAWPVSVMEAMGAGLPVISSDIGATSEMIVSGVDGILVPQKDEAAICSSLCLLANDIQVRERMGHAARRTACQRFDVSTTARLLRDAVAETGLGK